MPYVPARLVLQAVVALEGAHPLTIVTIPALLRAGVAAGQSPVSHGLAFGSTEEAALLDEFFTLPRPPETDRPWRVPWANPESDEAWQKRKYPGGGLQRLRTDMAGRGRVLVQAKNAAGRRDAWALTPTAGADLTAAGAKQVRLVDLALWLGREQNVPDLTGLMAWFNAEFSPNQGDLVGTIYDTSIPGSYTQVAFSSQPVDDGTFEQLGSLPPAPTVAGTLPQLVDRLEASMVAERWEPVPGLVRRVLTAWLRGDIVILVGQPGTGKTMFAGLLGRAMQAEVGLDTPVLVPVRADFDEAEFIGYERLDGTVELRQFAREVLKSLQPLEAKVVVLEEFNLALVESYLAGVLVANQEQERLVLLPAGDQGQLPVDTFIIATCNSYRDEPETRTRISSPTKRRSTTITMPNVLADRYEDDPDDAVLGLVTSIIEREADRVHSRLAANRGAQFDALRSEALRGVESVQSLTPAVRDAIATVTAAILNTPAGSSWFTIGLLKDVVLEVAHAEREEQAELTALGQAVADKLVHQLRGTHADAQELRQACAHLPNAAEIDRLLERMMDGPADELLPLV